MQERYFQNHFPELSTFDLNIRNEIYKQAKNDILKGKGFKRKFISSALIGLSVGLFSCTFSLVLFNSMDISEISYLGGMAGILAAIHNQYKEANLLRPRIQELAKQYEN